MFNRGCFLAFRGKEGHFSLQVSLYMTKRDIKALWGKLKKIIRKRADLFFRNSRIKQKQKVNAKPLSHIVNQHSIIQIKLLTKFLLMLLPMVKFLM